MAGKMVYDFLGGLRFIAYNRVYDRYEIRLGPLGRWLLGFALVFLAVGAMMQRERQLRAFTAVRYKNKRAWWTHHFLACFSGGLLTAFLYWLILHLLDRAFGLTAEEAVKEHLILLLWLLHVLTMVCLYSFLAQTALSRTAAVVLLIAEALTLVAAFFFSDMARFLFGTWGMYLQSGWANPANGFSVLTILFTETLLMILSFLAGLRRICKMDWDFRE